VNVGVGDLTSQRWRWCGPVKDDVHGFVPPPRPHPEPVAEHRPPNQKVRFLCGPGGEQEVIPVNENRHLRYSINMVPQSEWICKGMSISGMGLCRATAFSDRNPERRVVATGEPRS
jgi:hypothetical protein